MADEAFSQGRGGKVVSQMSARSLAVIGAVIGEFVGSSEGLGFLLLSATSQLDTPLAFAALFALSVLGIFVYALVGMGERLMSPWLPPPCRTRPRGLRQ